VGRMGQIKMYNTILFLIVFFYIASGPEQKFAPDAVQPLGGPTKTHIIKKKNKNTENFVTKLFNNNVYLPTL
jgi:hypothetical protein